ncbi:jg17773 [Pararge aegeria aegeria]|uniref:Jg17773 protein n=1 Tax=Pararge aegeria aegeria TaxID=348720 RepID=A0A8S4R9W0_9NEOP|nr:jg17773 [Pararge aegeria aegeria]
MNPIHQLISHSLPPDFALRHRIKSIAHDICAWRVQYVCVAAPVVSYDTASTQDYLQLSQYPLRSLQDLSVKTVISSPAR